MGRLLGRLHGSVIGRSPPENPAIPLLAVVGLYNEFNKLVDSLQVDPDVVPDPGWAETR